MVRGFRIILVITCFISLGVGENAGVLQSLQGGDSNQSLVIGVLYNILNDISELRSENTIIREENKALQEGVEAQTATINALNDAVGTLENQMQQLENQLQDDQRETVYSQMEYHGMHTFSAVGHTVKFATTIANVGNAFNTATGQFEAPVGGTYLFTATMCTFTTVWTHFYIKQDGKRLATGTVGDPHWGECGSATAVTYMRKGSKVWVETGDTYERQTLTISARHTFTGVLLNTYQTP